MRKIYLVLIIIVLVISGCAQQVEETNPETGSSNFSAVKANDIQSNKYPDTWYDFSSQQPILDDSGDASSYDIKKVYVANDENYIYTAFEVKGEKIDCTTMIHGGKCVFVTIDMPNYFLVTDNNKEVYADNEGNGEYFEIVNYNYEDGILQIRVPLNIYEGSKEFTINTLSRENLSGTKNEVDKCDDFKYSIK